VALDAAQKKTPTVLLLGGLNGSADESVHRVLAATAKFEDTRPSRRRFNLIAIGAANPDGVPLQFPPTGVAYRENTEANVLWRWIGLHAPDLVIVVGEEDYGLADALSRNVVAGVGRIPARRVRAGDAVLNVDTRTLAPSEARVEMTRRAARTPRELANELAEVYGHELDQPLYIQALALISRVRLGDLQDVKRLAEPYVDGRKDSLARPSSLVLAGHLVFAELARRTGDPRYVQMVRKAADLGFEGDGRMKESMPYHDGYSDSVFMGTVIAAEAGALTGERKYFDLAARHVEFMQNLVLRPDGLYRHTPAIDAAWGRGNGFPAIGLALALPLFPEDHPGRPRLLQAFQAHMNALVGYQDRDGLWRNVIDHPGTFAEISGTAMIGFSMLQGVKHGWLPREKFQPVIDKAWGAVLARSGPKGHMVDVCESTFNLRTVEDYVRRAALFGADARGGAMALLFATAMAGLD
jgi:unsaturated rhamnogalacturonyl hydrolase